MFIFFQILGYISHLFRRILTPFHKDTRLIKAERDGLPDQLKGGKLVLNEQMIRTLSPARLHGKIDQAVLTRAKELVPIDTKTRSTPRLKLSDVIQLSVYGTILRNTAKYPVSPRGYIRNVHPKTKKVKYLPVTLMSDDQVLQLRRQYVDLRSRRCTRVRILKNECWFCEFRSDCKKSA